MRCADFGDRGGVGVLRAGEIVAIVTRIDLIKFSDEQAPNSTGTVAIFATLSPGNKVLACADVYGGTCRMLKHVFGKYGVIPVFTDDTSPAAFADLDQALDKA